jgi:hypothetical protein
VENVSVLWIPRMVAIEILLGKKRAWEKTPTLHSAGRPALRLHTPRARNVVGRVERNRRKEHSRNADGGGEGLRGGRITARYSAKLWVGEYGATVKRKRP